MGPVLSTFFVALFAFACLCTGVCAIKKEWKSARRVWTIIAILAFALALAASYAKR